MTTAGWLRVTTYVLVADGLCGLYLGGILGPLGAALVATVAAATWWSEPLRARLGRVAGGGALPAVVATMVSALDLLYLADSVLDGFVHLLLFLLLYRLYTRTSLRDVRDIGFLGFFMLVAAAPGTFDVSFLFVFLVFLGAGTAMLILRHVLAESESAAAMPAVAGAVRGRHVLGLSLAATAATLVITATLFFVIPRIGQAALPLRVKTNRMVSGFSERVALGAFGEIEMDSTVVMRVHVPEGTPGPEQIAELRWRGVALDHFDGRTWTRDEPDRMTVRRSPSGAFEIGRARGTGRFLAQEVYLEPLGTQIIFAAPRVLRVVLRTDVVTVDGAGSLWAPSAAARLQYVVESELDSVPPRRAARREPLDDDARARYLQLPPLAPRVGELAREVTAGSAHPYEAATRLSAHLWTRYRYSTTLARKTELPPVEEFLFESRSGNCEYFAASLAVMLRELGIPARVVNGFQRGEWNPYGSYFMVRLLDAHSWVEAYVDDVGWVTLDPSPRAAPSAVAARASMNLYLDALRLRWYRHVVNWSLYDQVAAAGKVREAAFAWSPSLDSVRVPTGVPRAALPLVAVAAALVVAVCWRRVRPVRAASGHPVPHFYARALRALARRGLRPEPGETAREFTGRVAAALPGCTAALHTLTAGYERARFGAVRLPADELAALDACVAALARGDP